MAAIALREVRELEAEGFSESDIKDIVLDEHRAAASREWWRRLTAARRGPRTSLRHRGEPVVEHPRARVAPRRPPEGSHKVKGHR
ncbi:MAG: hypothetical protein MZW92_53605 [Comamonadaceae bacterium]|nr:hypothetical protein [Comamonadaceae bacterium]